MCPWRRPREVLQEHTLIGTKRLIKDRGIDEWVKSLYFIELWEGTTAFSEKHFHKDQQVLGKSRRCFPTEYYKLVVSLLRVDTFSLSVVVSEAASTREV